MTTELAQQDVPTPAGPPPTTVDDGAQEPAASPTSAPAGAPLGAGTPTAGLETTATSAGEPASGATARSLPLDGVSLMVLLVAFLCLAGARTRLGKKVPAGAAQRRSRGKLTDRPIEERPHFPGAVLVALAVIDLAVLVGEHDLGAAGVMSGALVAIGYVASPAVTGLSMGVVGIVVIVLDRLAMGQCDQHYSTSTNLAFLAVVAVLLAGVFVRLWRVPLNPPTIPDHTMGFWSWRGRERLPGRAGILALAAFGVVDLVSFVLQPAVLDGLSAHHGLGLLGVAALAGAVSVGVLVGAAASPRFTLSALGIGVASGKLLLHPFHPAECIRLNVIVATGLTFGAVMLIAKRVIP
jgi:hypothetical protein